MRAYHEQSRQALSQLEAPFSFYQRDKDRAAAAAAAAAVAAAADREAEIQKPSFRAKPVPAFIRKVLGIASPLCHPHQQSIVLD